MNLLQIAREILGIVFSVKPLNSAQQNQPPSTSLSIALSGNRLERIKQTLSASYEEYKSLRAEYAQHISYQHQILTLTFVLAGAVLGASPALVNAKVPGVAWIYPLAALVFVGISWTQLRYLEANVGIRTYIILRLIPRIENLFKQLYDDPEFDNPSVFAWEYEGMKLTYRREWWLFPIIGSRIFLSLLASITSLVVFWAFSFSNYWLSPHHWLCKYCSVTIVILIALIVFTTWVTFKVLKDVREGPPEVNPNAQGPPL
jgi:hypothetical protein